METTITLTQSEILMIKSALAIKSEQYTEWSEWMTKIYSILGKLDK